MSGNLFKVSHQETSIIQTLAFQSKKKNTALSGVLRLKLLRPSAKVHAAVGVVSGCNKSKNPFDRYP